MPFHYAEANANQVTQSAFDPISREPNYKQSAVRVERTGAMTSMKRLVVVGNGMAGMALRRADPQARAAFRHHRVRRRDARQLQPHPAVVGARRREGGGRHHAEPARVVPAERHRRCASACAIDRRRCRREDRHRRRRQRDAVRHAAARHRQLARGCRRSTGSTRTASSRSARSTTRARCSSARARASRRSSSAAACSASKRRAACRCRAATSPSCT